MTSGKRVTRSHCDDHQFSARREPEEHSEDESYNPRGKIIYRTAGGGKLKAIYGQ